MGTQPTKEKMLQLIKECSKVNYSKNYIYKIDYQNDQEMDLYIDDDDSLYKKYHSQDDSPVFSDVRNSHSFPYITFGIIYIKLVNDETLEQICFLIYKNILVTYFPFLDDKNIIEVRTSFSDEILNLRDCRQYKEKNLIIFFLHDKSLSKWIGVEQYVGYLEEKKDRNENDKKKNVKIIFVRDKLELEKNESLLSNEDDNNSENDNNNLILTEFYYDINDLKKLRDNKNLQNEKRIAGGLIYYKNKKGGAYAIGIIDKDLNPFLFDRETLNFLHNIIYGKRTYSVSGFDGNVIELDLSKKNFGPSHIKILTEFNLINLKKLNLLKNQIGPQGAFYLGQSKFNNLEILILNFNDIGDEGIEYLSKGPFLNLKYLYLYHNNLSNEAVNIILDSIFVDTLVLLDISDNPNINNIGIKYIKEKTQKNNNVLKNLRSFNLSSININDKALEIMAEIDFQKLKKLVLKGIKFTNPENINNIFKNKNYEVIFDNKIELAKK